MAFIPSRPRMHRMHGSKACRSVVYRPWSGLALPASCSSRAISADAAKATSRQFPLTTVPIQSDRWRPNRSPSCARSDMRNSLWLDMIAALGCCRLALDNADAVEQLVIMDIIPALNFSEAMNAEIAQDYFYFSFLTQDYPIPDRLVQNDAEAFMWLILLGLSDKPGRLCRHGSRRLSGRKHHTGRSQCNVRMFPCGFSYRPASRRA